MLEPMNRRQFLASASAAAALTATGLPVAGQNQDRNAAMMASRMMPQNGEFSLPDLPYAYDALEPVIDAQTMELHHTGHHQSYVDKLNAAIKDTPQAQRSLGSIISSRPESLSKAIRNNGGGHANHTFFWHIMTPDGNDEMSDGLRQALTTTYGSVDSFKQKFNREAEGRFGSGWAWLTINGQGKLQCYSLPNQDSPYMFGQTPLLGLDVWEHAYYLKYRNKRADYIRNWWDVVNWREVSRIYDSVT